SSPVLIQTVDGTGMIVKDWIFSSTPTYSTDPVYKWQLVLNASAVNNGDLMVPAQSGGMYGDLTSLATLAGQNTMPPSEKLFGNHKIVNVDTSLVSPGIGPYFDPSYGVSYASSADFETKAIDGYFFHVDGEAVNVFHARRSGGSVNVTLVP